MQKNLHCKSPLELESWKALEAHQKKIANTSIKDHFKNDELVDVSRTETEKSSDNIVTKVFCKNIYGIQYNNETKYWVPFRHGEVDVVKFSED